ncbi:single-stranded DNA-binding protein [Micromonospora sp. NPDC002389]|uniref:single-stranded DNA-binding protein n=1 Tax=Micromonospora sp. NPDC002389 TaxID=3154272 RepID=UPI003320186F
MFDTYVTVVGNVLTAPEWRRTTQSNTLVANFKVASTARRLDRDSGRWVDGNSLRVRVNCWRKLAEGVASSVMVGDPVVVCGRLYTRDWTDDAGNHRTLYELEAVAVGHDLSRGRGRFLRNKPNLATSTISDAEAEQRVHGELTEAVSDDDAPALPEDGPLDDDFELSEYVPAGTGYPQRLGEADPFDDLPGTGDIAGADGTSGTGGRTGADGFSGTGDLRITDGLAGDLPSTGGFSATGGLPDTGDSTPGGSESAEAGGDAEEPTAASANAPAESGTGATATGRGRRGRGRLPQPV